MAFNIVMAILAVVAISFAAVTVSAQSAEPEWQRLSPDEWQAPTYQAEALVEFEIQGFARADGLSAADQSALVSAWLTAAQVADNLGVENNVYLFRRP